MRDNGTSTFRRSLAPPATRRRAVTFPDMERDRGDWNRDDDSVRCSELDVVRTCVAKRFYVELGHI